jgi:murein DD-endopeptidase MepM/ murein hydrolase activator NlpD
MRGFRLRRAAIAATLLSTIIVPAVGSLAGPGDDLRRTQNELEAVRDRLEADRAQAGSLRDEIDALERSIGDLQALLGRLNAQIADVRSKVRTAKAEIAETQARIDAIEEKATDQAVSLYKSGDAEVLDALLESKSLAELDARAQLLGVAAKENTGVLIEYGRLKVQIRDKASKLLALEEELETTIADRSDVLADLSDRKEELDGKYAKISNEIAHLKHREGDLAAEAEALRDEILASQASNAVAALGTSAQGFIWPLNGAINSGYGPRWGGMHTGLDIDGYTGQPVVASKDGRVILSSGYSGYGNTVIIDHGGGIATLYAHLSAFDVSAGSSVSQGQVVGRVGCTGSCTGDHLHFEVRVNGSPVDPLSYLP